MVVMRNALALSWFCSAQTPCSSPCSACKTFFISTIAWTPKRHKHDLLCNESGLYGCCRLRTDYQEACLDFVQLQRIDFNASFSCSCHGGVTADGITLGFHNVQMSLVSLSQAEDGAELVRGSLFSERLFVKSSNIR